MSDFTAQDPTAQAVYQHNQKTFQHLKTAVSLNLRRQFFIALCDNLNLRNQFAMQLQAELGSPGAEKQFVSLMLDLADPNPVGQVATWLQQHPHALKEGNILGFQILGIEGLTRQVPAVQRLFLSYLRTIERSLPRLNCTVLLWVTRPWGSTIQQAAPECWSWSTGIFEFAGDPVPLLSNLFDPILFPSADKPSVSRSESGAKDPKGAVLNSPSPPATPPSIPNPSQADFDRTENDRLAYAELKEILEQDLAALAQDSSTNWNALAGFDWIQSGEVESPPDDRQQTDRRETVQTTTPSTATSSYTSPPYRSTSSQPTSTSYTSTHLETVINPTAVEDLASLADLASSISTDPLDRFEQSYAEESADFPEEDNPLPAILNPIATRSMNVAELEAQIETLRSQGGALVDLAQVHLNLGRYYRQCIEQGDVALTTLVKAIGAYEQVLEWLCFSEISAESMGDMTWPDILNDLGTLYWIASRNTAPENGGQDYLQQAVQAYQLGLKKIDEAEHPRSYAMLQNNLGTVFSDLAQWENTLQYLQWAVEAYEAALKYRRPDTDPLKFAATQNNLGTAFWHLAQHSDMAYNLKRAINAYNQALRYYRADREPGSYAMIQNNLGTAYWNLSQCVEDCSTEASLSLDSVEKGTPHQSTSRDWLLLAVNAYQSALRFRTLESATAAYAATQNNLGTAYWHLANLASDQPATVKSYLKLSIEAYTAALQAAHKLEQKGQIPALSFDRYATHNNLGLILYQRATLKEDLNGESPETLPSENQLASALHHHLQALKGWQTYPDLYQTALNAIVQTIRTCYEYWGTAGQNRALNQVPGSLLAEVLGKL